VSRCIGVVAVDAVVAYPTVQRFKHGVLVETSSSVNGTWTPIGQVMGTNGTNATEFEDTVPHIINSIRLFRVRIR